MALNGDCISSEVIDRNGKCKDELSMGFEDIVYEFDEAIEIAGTGWYNRGLLLTLSIGLLGMGIDIFGFSIIVTGCACDFHVNMWQRSVLMSMPFIGPILMSIAWGYVSDTRGRKKALLIALWGSFLSSFISAFSYNWIMLAILKVSSTCFAIQSCAYPLLGESCACRVRGFYMLIMTSVLMLFLVSYVVPGYFILNFNFAINLGLITFTPWRLLTIVMASPLGISAFLLHFYYESPKFLLNAGCERQALDYLTRIYVRNGGRADDYPVHRLVLNENIKTQRKSPDTHILKSIWEQTIPLFQPPLLGTTCQLFFLTTVVYSINNALVMWLPHIVESFTAGINSAEDEEARSLCTIIISTGGSSDDTTIICTSTIKSRTLLSGVTHGLLFAGVTLAVSKLGSQKKGLMIAFLLIPLLSSVGAVFNENNVVSLLLFVGMMMTNLCMGPLFAYYVDLYPTSYRGMAACLGVMMARISGLGGVNFLGTYVMTHCTMTFYAFSAYLLCGILVAAYFLPPGKS